MLTSDIDYRSVIATQRDRLERLERLRDRGVTSDTQLADALGRDEAPMSRDPDSLFENASIDSEREGRRKSPVLAHRTVLIEPLF